MNQQTYWTSWRKGISLSATFLLALLVAVSCKKETNTLGIGALDPESLLSSGGTDTFNLLTYTEPEDTFVTDNSNFYVPYGITGQYNDPKFGTFKADLYTQIHPTSTIQFTTVQDLVIDSVVLALRYGGSYGKLDAQTFSVYRLGEDIHNDSTYHKDDVKAVIGNDLVLPSNATQTPKTGVNDSVMVGTVKQAAQLRLRMDPTLGTDLIMGAYNGTYTDDATFADFFKGLRIGVTDPTPASGNGAVIYFKPYDNISRLTVYYKLGTVANSITYEIDGNCKFFNHTDINNAGYPVESVMQNHLNGQNQYYAQAFQSRAVVQIPGIDDIPKNGIVHDALLVIPVSHQSLSLYAPSTALRVGYYALVNGVRILKVKDIAYDLANKRYVIDIRDYVQDVVLGDQENTGIYMYPTLFSATGERIIFNGPNTTNKFKPKLIVKYTEY